MTFVIKEGYCTKLHAAIKQESESNIYTYKVLLEERTGDEHHQIIAVCGRHMVELRKDGRYSLWFVTSDDAEPYRTGYRHINEMLHDLGIQEKIENIHYMLPEGFKNKFLPASCDPTCKYQDLS